MDLFSHFCNICCKTSDENLKNISEENEQLKDILIAFIGHADIINKNTIYLCHICCNELTRFNKFRVMCFSNLIKLCEMYLNIKSQLELEDDEVTNTVKEFLHTEVLRYISVGKSNNTDSISTELQETVKDSASSNKNDAIGNKEVLNLCSFSDGVSLEIDSNCSNTSCDDSQVKFTKGNLHKATETHKFFEKMKSETVESGSELTEEELDMKIKIQNSNSELLLKNTENIKLEKVDTESEEEFDWSVINNSNETGPSEMDVMKNELHTECEIDDSHLEYFEVTNFDSESEFEFPVLSNNDGNDDNSQIESTKGELHVEQKSGTSSKSGADKMYIQPNNSSCSTTLHSASNELHKVFTESRTLSKHEHSGTRRHKCSYCNKTFASSSDLTRHENIHDDTRPYKCTVCNKAFTRVYHLARHNSTHSGARPYECSVCKKAFTCSSSLIRHERIHTDVKPYSCRFCDKAFRDLSNLNTHERIHTGKKPYKCTVCQKAFTDASSLVKHASIHSGARPYECSVCKKTFTRSSNLTRHKCTAKGSRPFKCTVCKKSFTRRYLLSNHACVPDVRQTE